MHILSKRTVRHTDLATIMQGDTDRVLIKTYKAWVGRYKPPQENSVWLDKDQSVEDLGDNCGSVHSDTKG